MRQENGQQEQGYLSLDFSYIFRRIGRNALIIIMCACIAGVITFILLDNCLKDTYTANMNLSVIARDNSSGRLADYNVSSAVTRSLSVLNSDTLKGQIYKAEENRGLSGGLAAWRVGETNIIAMSATSTSAENAFRLLKAALDNYPKLSSYFETGYLVQNLGSLSADRISINSARPAYYAALAVLFVLAAGIGLNGCMCLFTDKIHSKEQAAAILDLDILGTLHYVKKKKGNKTILISGSGMDISYAEEIDRTVTRIKGKMDAKKLKTLMISSVQENEGKSTVAANIALNLAKRGKKVMLIDADLRRPALFKIFEKKPEESQDFSNYLQENSDLKQLLKQEGKKNEITFILQSKAVTEPDKLLQQGRIEEVLKTVSEKMDYVIMDTPPIGIVRDAEVIAGYTDAIMLVFRQDQTRAAAINDLVDILDDTGTVALGGILNMAKGETFSPNHKNRYGKYYYGYGNE